MELLAELVLQIIVFIGELLFSVVGQALLDGLGMVFDWKRAEPKIVSEPRPAGPVLQVLGYVAFGVLCGLVTLWIAPAHLIGASWLRWLNFVSAPLIAGLALVWWRRLLGRDLPQAWPQPFANGAALAFALGLTRLMFAR